MKTFAQNIKKIELYSKRLMHANMLGNARTVKKGFGLEFDQLRDYQIGDDVRAVDWKSSARMNKLLIKQFNEESHRTILIAIDVSSSLVYGSHTVLKKELVNNLAGIIALAGSLAKDAIGLLLFSDQIELYIPPKKGKTHFHCIVEKIFSFEKTNKKTNLNQAFDYILSLRKKNLMVFVISDFIDSFEQKLSLLSRVHDVIAIHTSDNFEVTFPRVGLITMRDIETGEERVVDARNSAAHSLNYYLTGRLQEQKKLFARNKVDLLTIGQRQDMVTALIDFFRKRKR